MFSKKNNSDSCRDTRCIQTVFPHVDDGLRRIPETFRAGPAAADFTRLTRARPPYTSSSCARAVGNDARVLHSLVTRRERTTRWTTRSAYGGRLCGGRFAGDVFSDVSRKTINERDLGEKRRRTTARFAPIKRQVRPIAWTEKKTNERIKNVLEFTARSSYCMLRFIKILRFVFSSIITEEKRENLNKNYRGRAS